MSTKTKIMLKTLGYTVLALAYLWFVIVLFPVWLTGGTIKSFLAVVIAVLGTTAIGLHFYGRRAKIIQKIENQKPEDSP